MAAIGRPKPACGGYNGDNRVEKSSRLVDNVSQPLVVSIGEVSLEGGGFNRTDRQHGQQHRMSRKRLLVHSNDAAICFGDCLSNFGSNTCRLLQSTFCRGETLC